MTSATLFMNSFDPRLVVGAGRGERAGPSPRKPGRPAVPIDSILGRRIEAIR